MDVQRTTIIAALALVLAVVAGGGVWAATTHSSTLTPGANESVSSVWVELQNETETKIEVYVGGKYDERLKDTDTADELDNATYSGNWSVDGSGSSATAVTDFPNLLIIGNFEDGDLSGWSGDTSKWSITSDSDAEWGSSSIKFTDTTADAWDELNHSVTAGKHNRVSYVVRDSAWNSKPMPVVDWTSGSNELTRIAVSGGGSKPGDGGSVIAHTGSDDSGWVDTGINIQQDTFYRIILYDIDYSTDTYSVKVVRLSDGKTLGSYSGLKFRDSPSQIDTVKAYGEASRFILDDFRAGGESATYTAPAKTATNATEMTASIPSVTGAEVTVKAQGYTDSGTWVTVDSQTVSSATTVSTDVSQLDYTEWRWKVTASPTGSSPSAEIGYTGVTNITYVPPTLIANTTTTPADSPSVKSVDIPSAYADADSYTVEVTGQQPSSVGYSTTQTGGAVAADGGAQQSDGVSLTLMGLVGGLVIAGVILHGRRR